MTRWGDTSSDEDHHRGERHNDEENKEATQESVDAVSFERGVWLLATVVTLEVIRLERASHLLLHSLVYCNL